MSDQISKENLLFFENENIDTKEFYRQKNKLNKKNDYNENESKEPEVESSDEQNNSPQNSPSSLDEFNDLVNDGNENEETASIFDESKCFEIPTQNDDSEDEKSKKEERINIINNSTSPTEPIQKQIDLIKRNKIEGERTHNFLRNNNRTQNRKSSLSSKKCIRERSRSKT